MSKDLILYFETADGAVDEFKMPTTWAICPDCRGEGGSSAHLGAITSDEWNGPDWDDESKELYLSGGYDRPCEHCGGSGKVKEVDRSRVAPDKLAAWDKQCQEITMERNEAYWERLHETGIMG